MALQRNEIKKKILEYMPEDPYAEEALLTIVDNILTRFTHTRKHFGVQVEPYIVVHDVGRISGEILITTETEEYLSEKPFSVSAFDLVKDFTH